MIRAFLMLVCMMCGTGVFANREPDIPRVLTVFTCQTTKGHYVEDMKSNGVQVIKTPQWQDLDWAIEDKFGVPMKVCRRVYEDVHDQAADFMFPRDRPIPLNPDISDPMICMFMAGHLKQDYGSGYFVYKVGCPQPMYTEDGQVARTPSGNIMYSDPPCPPDCDCIDGHGEL